MATAVRRHPWQPLLEELARSPTFYVLAPSVVFLYLTFFALPYTPILVSGDWPILAFNGWRLASGETMYKDVFDFVLPGTELMYALLFKVFGAKVWVVNAITMGACLATVWLGVFVSRKVLSGLAVLLPSLLFLTVSFWRNGNGTHHWFSIPFAVAALAVLMEKRSPARLATAGALCAVSTFFTQVHGLTALAGFAAFVIWEGRRERAGWRALLKKEASLIVPYVLTLAALCAYFVVKAGWRRFLFCTVTFGINYYPAGPDNHIGATYLTGLPSLTHPLSLGLWLVLPVVVQFVVVFFYVETRRHRQVLAAGQWEKLLLLNFMALFLLLGVAPAPNSFRFSTASLPAFVIFVWLLQSEGWVYRAVYYAFWCGVLYLTYLGPKSMQVQPMQIVHVPAGTVAALDADDCQVLDWLKTHTKPNEYVFDSDDGGTYCFYLHLRNPSEVSTLTSNDYTRPEQVQNVVEGLEKHRVRFVMDDSGELDAIGPIAPGDHRGPFRDYVRQHYHLVQTLPENYQVWERNDAPE